MRTQQDVGGAVVHDDGRDGPRDSRRRRWGVGWDHGGEGAGRGDVVAAAGAMRDRVVAPVWQLQCCSPQPTIVALYRASAVGLLACEYNMGSPLWSVVCSIPLP